MASNYTITNSTTLTPTITLTSLATATTANGRQGVFLDFGTNRAAQWLCLLQTKPAAAPTAGGPLTVYLAFATATALFPAGASGADAAYTGPDAIPIDGVTQATMIGVLAALATAVAYVKVLGPFQAPLRYAAPIVINGWSQALSSTAGDHVMTFIDMLDQGP